MAVKQKAAPKSAKVGNRQTSFVCTVKPEAKMVYLVGEFNDWDTNAHRMIKRGKGFQKTLDLAPGEYQYKFLVDGEWHCDPEAEQVPNEYGTTNSLVRVQDA